MFAESIYSPLFYQMHTITMKTFPRLLFCTVFFTISFGLQAQLFDRLLKKKDKTKTEQQTKTDGDKKNVQQETTGNAIEANDKRFKYRCYVLNTDVEKADIDSCTARENMEMITEMQYYEQGEDVRFKDKGASVTLQFKDDTKRLIAINVEDIDDVAVVQQLQQMVLGQMGNPTMGYEVMKNYDGPDNNVWSDYTTYEYVYRYVFGSNVYDFEVTQFGAKMKNGKVVHPYNFSATVNKKREVALDVSNNTGADDKDAATDDDDQAKDKKDKKKEKKAKKADDPNSKQNFYPAVGVSQVGDCSVESRMLRKW